MRDEVRAWALQARGFLAESEGMALYRLAAEASRRGPVVEIGSYCGKSALFLGEGCRSAGANPTFTVDHHRGNEEQRPGGPYFDPEMWDAETGTPRTLAELVGNIRHVGLEDWVVPVVGEATVVGRALPAGKLGLVFIDGGHSAADVAADVATWAPRIGRGGYLCMHDVYPDPADGGQAPLQAFTALRAERKWRFVELTGSLGVLQRR